MKKILSIITVCRNSEKTIEETIKSIIIEKNQHIEYIIIDGASSDTTLSIVNSYKKDIDIIISEKDNGIADAFNKGIKAASGKFIWFINSDDNLQKNTANLLLQKILRNDYDIYCFSMKIKKNQKEYTIVNSNHARLFYGMYVAHPATIVSKSTYEKIGFFNENFLYAMDYEFLLRCIKENIRFFSDDLVIIEMNSGGISDRQYLLAAFECVKAYHIVYKNIFFTLLFSLNYLVRRIAIRYIRGN